MKILATILIVTTCPSAHAFIGQTVKDVETVYGEPASTFESSEGGTYYTFKNTNTSVSFRPIKRKILDIRFEYSGKDRESFLNEHLGDIHTGWETQVVSSAEISIFSFNRKNPDCIKLRNDKKMMTA